MITIPTVLILGAGSSAHCGYPLGHQLVTQLSGLRGNKNNEMNRLPEGWKREEAEDFITRLSRSGYPSIDAFLEANQGQAQLGKFLITREMKKHEVIDNLFPPYDAGWGWYLYLFNKLIADAGPEFSKSELKIVTFNYDRSLEAYLHTALQNRFRINEEDATSFLRQLPIVHVHGILGEYPEVPYEPEDDVSKILKISEQIRIIHEIADKDDEFCNPMFGQANQMMHSAERIFFLGFGFHHDNIRRFRFFNSENTQKKQIRATMSGLQPLEWERLVRGLENFGLRSSELPNNYADCDLFFKRIADLE